MNTTTHPDLIKELLTEITAPQLAQLLDEHLADFIQLCAANGEPLMREQASAYHHIRRLRDLIKSIDHEA